MLDFKGYVGVFLNVGAVLLVAYELLKVLISYRPDRYLVFPNTRRYLIAIYTCSIIALIGAMSALFRIAQFDSFEAGFPDALAKWMSIIASSFIQISIVLLLNFSLYRYINFLDSLYPARNNKQEYWIFLALRASVICSATLAIIFDIIRRNVKQGHNFTVVFEISATLTNVEFLITDIICWVILLDKLVKSDLLSLATPAERKLLKRKLMLLVVFNLFLDAFTAYDFFGTGGRATFSTMLLVVHFVVSCRMLEIVHNSIADLEEEYQRKCGYRV